MIHNNAYFSKRLLLKPTTKEDAAFILELLNSPKWIENIGDRNLKSVADAEQYIQTRYTPQLERLGFSNYTLIRREDNLKIGVCGLIDREGIEGIEIGYALLPQYEKMGFAFEAAEKLMWVALEKFGIQSLKAITAKHNIPSQNLLLKLGFQFSGTTKLPDDAEELILYQFHNKKV